MWCNNTFYFCFKKLYNLCIREISLIDRRAELASKSFHCNKPRSLYDFDYGIWSKSIEKCSGSSQIQDTEKSAENYKLQSVHLWSCIAKKHDKDFFLYPVSHYFLKKQYLPYSYQSKNYSEIISNHFKCVVVRYI